MNKSTGFKQVPRRPKVLEYLSQRSNYEMTNTWDSAMKLALAEANQSGQDVPVGAILVDPDGNVVAAAHNEREATGDPTAHAEILAIQRAGKASSKWRLDELTMVVTLEPCVMCAGAIVAARIPRIVFGAFDDRVGGAGSRYDLVRDSRLGSPVEVITGVMQEECSKLLKDFFEKRR
jgi:tRNA(adenine34) deaminase